MKSVDIIIPTYRPDKKFRELLEKLAEQTYPINQILIMNTEKEYWDNSLESNYPMLKVVHLLKKQFDHGGTRKWAAELSHSDIMIFMTQDAVPANEKLVECLVNALCQGDEVGAAYARQLPTEECNELERFTRTFNYPADSHRRVKADLPQYGIKTYFCSNVCAAYKKDVYVKTGGFVEKTIFNEDMIYAGRMIEAGYAVAYAADAMVIHSHNYSCMQQVRRNFDLGVSQAQYQDVFGGIASEGEGLRLVMNTFFYLIKKGKIWLVPKLIIQSGGKYIGFWTGKRYKKIPRSFILKLTMNRTYWD